MNNLNKTLGAIIVITFFISCEKKPISPSLSTIAVTEISTSSAVSGGTITDDGGASIISKGICWNTITNPSIANSKTSESGESFTFTGNITQLTPNTQYYVRAYATNKTGTGYGNQEMFKTEPATIADIDGNIYDIIKIGTQSWTKENLKVTRYSNGDLIETTTPATKDIRSESTPKYQWANYGNESKVATYGRYYTWYVITDSRGVCPTGWHIPTDTEWTTLASYLGGESIAGGKLKEIGTTHWENPNTGADNSSGFTALPSGFRYSNGTFTDFTFSCTFWSSTEYSNEYPWLRDLYATDDYLNRYYGYGKSYGFSVRCLKD